MKQPLFVYDITKKWEEVVKKGPIWLSNKFPPLPKDKKYSFLGYKLISPVAISAGPASRKIWTDFYLRMGYGFVLEKTRRTIERKAHKEPNVAIIEKKGQVKRSNINKTLVATNNQSGWEKYKSITNSFGNPSPSIEIWSAELKKQIKSTKNGQILGCSVTATFFGGETTSDIVADLLKAATAAAKAGIKVIEFNLACPNVTDNKEEGEMFQDAALVSYTLKAFKKKFPKVKAGIKFGLYKNKAQMKKVFKDAGKNLDYVSGINAIAMTVLRQDGKEILPGRTKSGVCGKLIQDIALESIEWANQIRKEEKLKYEILGGGGIVEVSDVDKFLKAGADMVQVATIVMVDPLFAYKYRLFKDGLL
ncbi:MAG: hypothetical protein AAB414_00170 [Patescibacteria group bacterium]